MAAIGIYSEIVIEVYDKGQDNGSVCPADVESVKYTYCKVVHCLAYTHLCLLLGEAGAAQCYDGPYQSSPTTLCWIHVC